MNKIHPMVWRYKTLKKFNVTVEAEIDFDAEADADSDAEADADTGDSAQALQDFVQMS